MPDGVPDGCEVVGVELDCSLTVTRPAEQASPETAPDVSAGTGDVVESPKTQAAPEVWILIDEHGIPVPSTIGENDQKTIVACSDAKVAQVLCDYQRNFDIVCRALRIR